MKHFQRGKSMPVVKRRQQATSPKSYWPADMQRLFQTLNEIPWASLTALSTLIGGSVLFAYFRSIGYQPTGPVELVGLGITTAFVSLALLVFFALVLFSPALIYQHALVGIDSSFKSVRQRKISVILAGLQCGVFGYSLLSTAYAQFNCNREYMVLLSIGLPLLVWGIFALIKITFVPTDWGKRLLSAFCALFVAICGALSVGVLLPIQQTLSSVGWLADLIFLGLLAATVVLNAVVAPALLGRSVALFALGVATYLLIVLPMMGTNPAFFPNLVAGAVGIRGAATQEMRISSKACQSLIGQMGTNSPINLPCTKGEWTSINALILSNVGDRWLVQIHSQELHSATENVEHLAVTIPREDIELSISRQRTVSASKVESACKG